MWYNIHDTFLLLYLIFMYIFLYNIIGLSYVTQKNILRLLFLFELLILIVSSMFLIVGEHYNDIYGQLVVMYLLTIAAVEASLGLALIYLNYKLWRSVKLEKLIKIKG